MSLNKDAKDELRKIVEQKLESIPKGYRIHLDKEMIEELLFDVRTEKLNPNTVVKEMANKPVKVKYIEWSGDFLSKIDLSEVSFEDVFWDIDAIHQSKEQFVSRDNSTFLSLKQLYGAATFDERKEYAKGEIENSEESIYFVIEGKQYYFPKHVNLSNTNAFIDFSNSFLGKYSSYYDYHNYNTHQNLNQNSITNVDFTNVDLSNNNMDGNYLFGNCSLNNTGLKFDLNKGLINLYDCDLRGLDFSNTVLDKSKLVESNGYNWKKDSSIKLCNFRDTGLKIVLDEEELDNSIPVSCSLTGIGSTSLDNYVGCYLNDQLINEKDKITDTKFNPKLLKYNKEIIEELDKYKKMIEQQTETPLEPVTPKFK